MSHDDTSSHDDTTTPSAPSAPEGPAKPKLSRRRFLLSGGLLLGGTMTALYFGRGPLRRAAAGFVSQMDLPSGIFDFEPDFWFAIQDDNTLLLKSPKVEMGQDIFTGFALLAAEELDIDPSAIVVRPGSTADSASDRSGTGGSSTTASLYVPLRQVAATLRQTLKGAAAAHWGVAVDEITTADGHLEAGERRMSYAEIHAATTDWTVADTPELRPAASFRYIGKDRRRTDLLPKVLGEPIYGIDAELPDMVYATVLYSPFIDGRLTSLDSSAAEAFPGVLQVLRQDDLVAVVAESRYAAEMGKRQLVAEWDVPKRWQQQEIDDWVTVGRGTSVSIQRQGDTASQLDDDQLDGQAVIEAEYRTPLAAHAHMEPNGVVAQVDGDSALIITGTQMADAVQSQVAKTLGLDKDKVEIRNCFLGGGFGRRYFRNNASDAARIARAVGRPVHVFKDREDEFRNGYLRPNAHHVYRAKLDGGAIVALEHQLASGDMFLESGPLAPVSWIFGADWISAGHGLHIHYDVPHKNAEMWQRNLPFQTGIWRGVGMVTNTFAGECFIDELAAAASADPLAFRLTHLSGEEPLIQRLRKVLETAAEASGWTRDREPNIGWGIACAEDRKTVVAAVAQVSVDGGRIRVHKITQVIDPGVIIHPEGVRNQVEGATMMGLSTALYEEIRVEDGQLHATNFHQYPMASLQDTPEIDVVLIEGSDKPSGVGEPPIAPVAPAIANAVFDLTGQRLRRLPLRLAQA